MNAPRCGLKDIENDSGLARGKRYAFQGSRWRVREMSYRISKYPSHLNDGQKVDKEIARAFKVWSDVTGIVFEEKKDRRVHIDIGFEGGGSEAHHTFDGPGTILAYAKYPQYGGEVRFDDEEDWSIDQPEGINIFQVAVHELGHSLGLYHSNNIKSAMAPRYDGYNPSFKLHEDDIAGIQFLYSDVEQRNSSSSDPPNICQDAVIDTVTCRGNSAYIFKGDYYWEILSEGIADGYPRRIYVDWPGLKGNLDASFTRLDGKTYFFKGKQYWKFNKYRMSPGFPKAISAGFKGIPDDIDAALWENGMIYFFKGNQYWLYNRRSKPRVSWDYPRPISDFMYVPNTVDAAFQWKNNKTYFFTKDKYYRFSDPSFQVLDEVYPPYPRYTSVGWFGCQYSQ